MPPTPTLNHGQVKDIPLQYIKTDPNQIRKTFDPVSLKELAEDIKHRGVEQPISVYKNGNGYLYIKHGERRFLACKLAKLTKIPCILVEKRTGDDADFKTFCDQHAENEQRDPLNTIEKAESFQQQIDVHEEMTVNNFHEYLKEYGINYARVTVINMIRLLELPQWAKDYIRARQLTQKHGRQLLQIKDLDDVMKEIKKEIDKELKSEDGYTVSELASDIVHIMYKNYPQAHQGYISENRALDDKSKNATTLPASASSIR